MLPLGLVQRRLRLVDSLLPAFTLLLPGGLFPGPFQLVAPLFPFLGESGLALRRLVDQTDERRASGGPDLIQRTACF